MLMMCGCVGQTGGGWAHYVGQEKLRPQPAGRRWPSRWTGAARRAR
jgi:nitrate reductase alpha subunit